REQGTWWWVGMIIIFGHFFLPFLSLLRIDVKETFMLMTPLCAWAWLMRYFDVSFNVMPVIHADGYPWKWAWLDFGCLAFIGGWLIKAFLKKYASCAPYPVKDPRLIEAMGLSHLMPLPPPGSEFETTEEFPHGVTQSSETRISRINANGPAPPPAKEPSR